MSRELWHAFSRALASVSLMLLVIVGAYQLFHHSFTAVLAGILGITAVPTLLPVESPAGPAVRLVGEWLGGVVAVTFCFVYLHLAWWAILLVAAAAAVIRFVQARAVATRPKQPKCGPLQKP